MSSPQEPELDRADDPFYQHVDPVRDAMRRLVEAGSALREGRHSIPAADSQAMAELNVESRFAGPLPWSDEPVHTAYSWAGILLLAAEDGMRCIDQLFSADKPPLFGHQVQARGVLEACARARWLLEARAGVQGRVERWFANRVADLTELSKLDLPPTPGSAPASEKLAEVLLEGESRGFARPKKGGKLKPCKPLPGYRQLVLDLFADGPFGHGNLPTVIYSLYSAIAHGQVFGLLESMDRDAAVRDELAGSASVPFVTRSEGLVGTMAIVIAGYAEAVDEQVRLMGWPHDEWPPARREAFGVVKAALPVALGS